MNVYSIYVEDEKTKQKIIIDFEVNGTYKSEGTLENIDYYLTQFKSLDAFLTYLLKEGKITVGSYKCYIVVNGRHKKDAIFNDSFIHAKCAETIKSGNSVLDGDEEIVKIAEQLIDIVLSDNDASNAMLYNRNFPNYIFEDLKRIVLAKFSNNDHVFQAYKTSLIKKLSYYSYLRDCYVWLNKYSSKKAKNEEYEQMSFEPQQIKPQYSKEEYEELANIAREQARNIKLKFTGISNPNIEYYFNEGGLSSVLENCSLDEITALPLDEQEYIGFIKQNERKR